MIRSARARHFRYSVLLALLVPVVLITALQARRTPPLIADSVLVPGDSRLNDTLDFETTRIAFAISTDDSSITLVSELIRSSDPLPAIGVLRSDSSVVIVASLSQLPGATVLPNPIEGTLVVYSAGHERIVGRFPEQYQP